MYPEQRELRQQYDLAKADLHAAADAVDAATEGRNGAALMAAVDRLEAARKTADQAQDRLELFTRTQEARSLSMPDIGGSAGRVRVNSEPLTYEAGNGHSFFRDPLHIKLGDQDAFKRLGDRRREMQVEMKKLAATPSARPTRPAATSFRRCTWPKTGPASRTAPGRSRALSTGARCRRRLTPSISRGSPAGRRSLLRPTTPASPAPIRSRTRFRLRCGPSPGRSTSPARAWNGASGPRPDHLRRPLRTWQTYRRSINRSGTGQQMKGALQVSGIETVTYTDASPTVPGAVSETRAGNLPRGHQPPQTGRHHPDAPPALGVDPRSS